jgi:hypothetical protein
MNRCVIDTGPRCFAIHAAGRLLQGKAAELHSSGRP